MGGTGSGGGQAGSPASGGSGGGMGGTGGGMGGTGGGTGGNGGSGGSGGSNVVPTKLCSETTNPVGEPCYLFDGTQASVALWGGVFGGDVKWELNTADKTLKVKTGTFDIKSKPKFQDLFVHAEYMTPKITSAGGGQERGNSGIYLKSSWEVQVLDTFGLAPTDDGCGAIYEVRAPTVSACKKEEEWNVYEIEFKAQVCTNGQQTTPANMVSVKLNDILVQENVPLPATATRAGENPPTCGPNGLLLQDHSSILPVTFRNIWVIPRSN
jgi:hypothetical protein